MNEGKSFEKDFFSKIDKDWTLVRLRDAGGWEKTEGKRFTIDNICDFVFFNGVKLFLLELKSYKTPSIPQKALKQLPDLMKYKGKLNTFPLFVFNFRSVNETYLMELQPIIECLEERKSIPLSLCREKGVLIPQKLKRVHYSYDLSKMNEYGEKNGKK